MVDAGLRRLGLGRLSPLRWPVRSRIAAVSAAITFVVLIAFALVVGRLATNQLTNDFREELRTTANELAASARVITTIEGQELRLESPNVRELVMSETGAVRVVDLNGTPLAESPANPELGPPTADMREVGDYEVVSRQIITSALAGGPIFVQYARSRASLDRTISRLWLFLGGGVFGGTLLAALAGFAVAGRAMRPITSLTATAREVAETRDPSRRIPPPESGDEVAELARILDEMLRELDAARSETEHMAQLQREFVADASHELRTPLTSILANLELLQESLARQAPADGEDAQIVEGALRSSRRMRWLVSDLLLLARADAGRAGVRRTCDLTEIATSARDEVRAFAADHRIVLEAPDRVPVEGNPEELHRMVLNLLENGVRHTPPDTEVRIALEVGERQALLEVSDDGPGLPEGLGDQVFARFVRGGRPADVSGDSGTGLGLAIVKAVAQSHGGVVEAGEASTGGARFTVTLPLSAAGEDGRPAPQASAERFRSG